MSLPRSAFLCLTLAFVVTQSHAASVNFNMEQSVLQKAEKDSDFDANALPFQLPAWTSAAPKPCCLPETLEIGVGITTDAKRGWRSTLSFVGGKISMDFKGGRMAGYYSVMAHGHVSSLGVIELTSENAMYIFYPKWKHCSKIPKAPPLQNCLPQNATYLGIITLGGAGGPSLDLDMWGVAVANERMRAHVQIQVTKACIPGSQLTMGKFGRTEVAQLDGFFNATASIPNPDVFNVPDYCKKDATPIPEAELNEILNQHQMRRAFL